MSDIILLGTEEQVRLAVFAAHEPADGKLVHTQELVGSLRNFIRETLDLDPIPAELNIPLQGPARPGSTDDGVNTYLYDAEGRVCAMHGPLGMIGYQYDASGNRIGKGTLSSMTCDMVAANYQPTNDYILDLSNAQMTEMAAGQGGAMTWQHTNVTAGGTLIATYDLTGLHFYLNDPLGSRRVQTDAAGVWEQNCQSLPYGDQLNCTMSTSAPTEHHFTGKERDAESGLDYFGARYYTSAVGRWMSPDWSVKEEPVPYSNLELPQSLNLYRYGSDNPLSNIDLDGHWPGCTCQAGPNNDLGHLLFRAVTNYNYYQAAQHWARSSRMTLRL